MANSEIMDKIKRLETGIDILNEEIEQLNHQIMEQKETILRAGYECEIAQLYFKTKINHRKIMINELGRLNNKAIRSDAEFVVDQVIYKHCFLKSARDLLDEELFNEVKSETEKTIQSKNKSKLISFLRSVYN